MRLGLIGHGRWGRNIERTLASFANVTVTILPHGAAATDGFDGVLVATPSASHAEVSLPWIERGIATFIEKPMATSVADAERIRDAAERSGAVVFVGHLHLYNPAFRAACEHAKRLGPIRYVLCEGMNDNPRTDSSVLWDWLPHHLSMMGMLLNTEPASTTAWTIASALRAEAAVSRFLFGEIPVICTTSWLSPVKRLGMTVVAEQGTVVFDDTAAQKLAVHDKSGRVSFPASDAEPALTAELQDFCHGICGGAVEPQYPHDGTAIVRAIAAAERSMETGGIAVSL